MRLCLATVLLLSSATRCACAADDAQTVRIAGVVLKWLKADKAANCDRAEAMIREAAAGGAQIVCTTECFLDGYAITNKEMPLEEYRALGEQIPGGPYYERLARLADELDIHLCAGMLEADGEQRYNTAAIISPDGDLIGKYRKHELGHELVRNTPGTELPVFETPHGRIGLMICADRRTPSLVNQLKENGAEILICPSGGMFGPRKNDPILQARSKETGLPIVFVHPAEFLVTGPGGIIDRRELLGDQLEIDPDDVGGDRDSSEVYYFEVVPYGADSEVNSHHATMSDWVYHRGPIGRLRVSTYISAPKGPLSVATAGAKEAITLNLGSSSIRRRLDDTIREFDTHSPNTRECTRLRNRLRQRHLQRDRQ